MEYVILGLGLVAFGLWFKYLWYWGVDIDRRWDDIRRRQREREEREKKKV